MGTNQGRRNKFHWGIETGEEFVFAPPVYRSYSRVITAFYRRMEHVHFRFAKVPRGAKVSDVADLPKYFPIDNRLPCNHPPLLGGIRIKVVPTCVLPDSIVSFFPTPRIYEILHTHAHVRTCRHLASTLVPNA